MLGVSLAEEPCAGAGDERAGDQREEKFCQAAQKNERAENRQRNGVGDQMLPTGVDEGGDHDSFQAAAGARHDSHSGRGESHRQEGIDAAHEPHQPDEEEQRQRPQFDTAVAVMELNHVLPAHVGWNC